MKDKLASRLCLDRRRLEEAFLLYAVLKTHFKYDLQLQHVNHDRNDLLRSVVDIFKERFEEQWSSKYASLVIKRYTCGRIYQRYTWSIYGLAHTTYTDDPTNYIGGSFSARLKCWCI